MTAFQAILDDVGCERENAEREGLLHWPHVMHRDVTFVAKLDSKFFGEVKIRNSPHEITTCGQDPTREDLLESISWIMSDFKDINPHEWEFCICGGFDGSDPTEDGDFYDDYEPWVSEWQSFDFDYQLQRI